MAPESARRRSVDRQDWMVLRMPGSGIDACYLRALTAGDLAGPGIVGSTEFPRRALTGGAIEFIPARVSVRIALGRTLAMI